MNKTPELELIGGKTLGQKLDEYEIDAESFTDTILDALDIIAENNATPDKALLDFSGNPPEMEKLIKTSANLAWYIEIAMTDEKMPEPIRPQPINGKATLGRVIDKIGIGRIPFVQSLSKLQHVISNNSSAPEILVRSIAEFTQLIRAGIKVLAANSENH